MGDGYVLNFSNKTLAEFFDDELGISIYDDRYEAEGNSTNASGPCQAP